jgi:hypothetical protein
VEKGERGKMDREERQKDRQTKKLGKGTVRQRREVKELRDIEERQREIKTEK